MESIEGGVMTEQPKRCPRCATEKPREEFYKSKGRPDGLSSRCKACSREGARAPHRVQKSREWYYANRDKVLRLQREHRRANPEYHREKDRKQRERHPEKFRARRALQHQVRVGTIIRPTVCPVCGGGGQIDAHHSDYSKPLDVEWMCKSCHGKGHQKRREEA